MTTNETNTAEITINSIYGDGNFANSDLPLWVEVLIKFCYFNQDSETAKSFADYLDDDNYDYFIEMPIAKEDKPKNLQGFAEWVAKEDMQDFYSFWKEQCDEEFLEKEDISADTTVLCGDYYDVAEQLRKFSHAAIMWDINGYYILGLVADNMPSSNTDILVARFNNIEKYNENNDDEDFDHLADEIENLYLPYPLNLRIY